MRHEFLQRRKGNSLTSGLLTMKVWVQTPVAHPGDLLDLAVRYVVQKLPEIGSGVHRLQLFFVEVQHLIDPLLVLELKEKKAEDHWL